MESQFSIGEDPEMLTTQLIASTDGVATPNHSYASTDLSVAVPGWEVDQAVQNSWIGWMRLARPNPGWGETQFGIGAVLASDRPDFNHPSAQGYAVLYRGGLEAERAVSLVRFTSGIREGTTEFPAGCVEIVSVPGDPGVDGLNFRVQLRETGIWELRVVSGPPLTEAQAVNPSNYTGGGAESASPDATHTGSDFRYAGWVWAHSGSTHHLSRAFFGNLGAGIAGTVVESPLEITSINLLNPAGGVSVGGNVSWEVVFDSEIVPGSIFAEDLELIAVSGDLDGAEVVGVTYANFDTIHVEASVGSGDKELALRIPEEARFEDRFGNVYTDDITSSATFLVDQTIPQVALGTPSVLLTSEGPVEIPVFYTDADSITLDTSDVEVITTNTSVGSVVVSGSDANERLVVLNDLSGDGEIAIRILAGTASSPGGNMAGASAVSAVITVDNTPPSVESITPDPAIPVASLSTIVLTFNEPVTVGTPDILSVGGVAATTMTGSGAGPYEFSGWTHPTDGSVPVVLADGGVVDLAGNPLGEQDWVYTVNASAVQAALSSPSVSDDGATSLTSVLLSLQFSEDVNGLTPAAFSASGATLSNLTGSGSDYTMVGTPLQDGSITIELAENAVNAVAPPNNGNTSASFSFIHDTTPPLVESTIETSWVFQDDITVEYTAEDSLSGVMNVSLMTQAPGEDSPSVTAVTEDASGEFIHTPVGSGVHRLAVVAMDHAGNSSVITPGDWHEVVVGTEPNGPLALEIPTGSNIEVVFPLGPDSSVTLSFDEVTSGNILSVERIPGAGNSGDFALDPELLAGQFFRIIDLGNLVFGQASITFVMPDHAFGSGISDLSDITTVYTIRGASITTLPLTPNGEGGLTANGVTEFSDWYPGAGNLRIEGWIDLME